MVDSKIEQENTKSPTYQLTESQHSQSSASREQSNYGTTIKQTPAGSSISGTSAYGASSEVSRTSAQGVQGATTSSTYQVGGQRTYQTRETPTYEAAKSGSGSGVYQSGTYQAGTSGSGIYQSGTSSSGIYQAGSTSGSGIYETQGGERSGTYPASNTYQPYQGNYSYQSSAYRSGTSGSGSGVGQPQSGNTGGNSQYSSSSTYKYEKK